MIYLFFGFAILTTHSVIFRVSCCMLFVNFQVHGPAVAVNFAVNMFSEL
jgi:hypothetical protein